MGEPVTIVFAALALIAAAPETITVTPAPAGTAVAKPLPLTIGGRVERSANGLRRQWPGTYLEGAFRGIAAQLRIGTGNATVAVTVDGVRVAQVAKPGLYTVAGLTPGRHTLRLDVASESQDAPTTLGALYAAAPLPAPTRPRSIEFIGDSHTVGYGNTSTTRDCTDAQVRTTTDTTRGVAALTAKRYGADYQVNAISGRGIVRNYNGLAADTLPVAYPYVLFDKTTRYADSAWRPQLIVIALGTNDFSTPLKPGERWATRDALHADYEATYAAFVRRLRAAHPRAQILLWATDLAGGEIAAETARVVRVLRDSHVAFVPVPGLAMSACHAHPSLADDQRIADRLADYIDAHPALWTGR